jgi:hypothetical protein
MNEFYVYIYFDPRIKGVFKYEDLEFEYEPFYIGKGKGLRMFKHLSQTGRCYKVNKIKAIRKVGLEPIIIKYKEGLIEAEAFKLEVELIETIGRKNLKTGPLTNVVESGKGNQNKGELSHMWGKKFSDIHKERISKAIKKWMESVKNDVQFKQKIKQGLKKHYETHDGAFKNKVHSKETKEKMSKTRKEKELALGEKNSQFGTCWIIKDGESKKIKKEDIEFYIKQGWEKGRKIKILKWKSDFLESIEKIGNEELLEETLSLASGDDYEGCFTE